MPVRGNTTTNHVAPRGRGGRVVAVRARRRRHEHDAQDAARAEVGDDLRAKGVHGTHRSGGIPNAAGRSAQSPDRDPRRGAEGGVDSRIRDVHEERHRQRKGTRRGIDPMVILSRDGRYGQSHRALGRVIRDRFRGYADDRIEGREGTGDGGDDRQQEQRTWGHVGDQPGRG